MKNKGMSTALAVVVGIIVLIIVAMAVIAVTTKSVTDVNQKEHNTVGQVKGKDILCKAYVTKELCEEHEGCYWTGASCESTNSYYSSHNIISAINANDCENKGGTWEHNRCYK